MRVLEEKKLPGWSRFAPIPPTTAARWTIASGFRSAIILSTSRSWVRSYVSEPKVRDVPVTVRGQRGQEMTSEEKPVPPVTTIREIRTNSGAAGGGCHAENLSVRAAEKSRKPLPGRAC